MILLLIEGMICLSCVVYVKEVFDVIEGVNKVEIFYENVSVMIIINGGVSVIDFIGVIEVLGYIVKENFLVENIVLNVYCDNENISNIESN